MSKAKTCESKRDPRLLTTTRSRPIPPPCRTRAKKREQRDSERREQTPARAGTGTYTVRRAAELEGVEVVLHVCRVDPRLLDPLLEQDRVVHPLSAREDLFAAHEKVVRVGKFLSRAGKQEKGLVSA